MLCELTKELFIFRKELSIVLHQILLKLLHFLVPLTHLFKISLIVNTKLIYLNNSLFELCDECRH